jgi:putative transposase
MDEEHLLAAGRYVELNPVRAGLCNRAGDWPWSSAQFHLRRRSDRLITAGGMRSYVDDWKAYLDETSLDAMADDLRRHSVNGRPAGCPSFISALESLSGRRLVPLRPGRKRK